MQIAALTGLRLCEVAALHVRDTDLRSGYVEVQLNKTHTSKGCVTSSPKSKAGKRDVPILDDQLFHDLGMFLHVHPYRENPDAGLWPRKIRGHNKLTYDRPFDPKGFYRNDFKPACKRAGV